MSTRRVKTDDMKGVTSLEQLQDNIKRIGILQNYIEFFTADANANIEKIKEDLKQKVSTFNDEIKILHKSSQVYFTANQLELLPVGKKSIAYSEGEIGTRSTPLSVVIKKDQTIDLAKALKEMGLKDCVGVTYNINKNGLKKHREQVEGLPGVSFRQKEEFYITPTHIPVEHTKQLDEKQQTNNSSVEA